MKTVYGDITHVRHGIVCQQVNCMNAYGAGLSGAIAVRWPEAKQAYRDSFRTKTGSELFGTFRLVQTKSGVTVANLYTQYGYGRNSGKCHTDMNALASCLRDVCQYAGAKCLTVYIPKNIGCGLGGGDWNELKKLIGGLPLIAVSNDPADAKLPKLKT